MGVVESAMSSYQSNRDLLKKKDPFELQKKFTHRKSDSPQFKEPDPTLLEDLRKRNIRIRKRETFWLWVTFLLIFTSLAGLFYSVLF